MAKTRTITPQRRETPCSETWLSGARHDRSWPSKQKVIQFIKTHRRYKELPVSAAAKPGFSKWLRRVIAAKWHWLRGAPFGIVTSAIAGRPEIAAFLKSAVLPQIDRPKLVRCAMGLVMEKFRGSLPGRTIAEMVAAFVA